MGCSWSSETSVQALRAADVKGSEDETGFKLDGRGDSAVSKGTADSGVVIEDGHVSALPGVVPGKPNLTSVTDGVLDRNRQDDIQLQSSEILEELENEGIIPVGQRDSVAGEAYSIMLDDGEAVRRRPPARLESLKAARKQSLPSREKCEEKMRLVEERRKLRENEIKTRLRAKSARVRVPAPTIISDADEDATNAPVAWTDERISPDLLDVTSFSQIEREEAEGEERVGGSSPDVRERKEQGEMGRSQGGSEDSDGEEEELTQVVELMNDV
ncbi:hypothetical protein D4764_21G0001710 [Takifugu flavidus]|uniref:Stathmin domain-containing protein 1 n=2 Tax=Takifugu flavidus TaxID=433684 RepID=A0A5C6NFB0_9TELE|nr:hypothetical protein D4764_21G0001710 [Takifugu flavidus]